MGMSRFLQRLNKSLWGAIIGYLGVVVFVFGRSLFPRPGQMIFGDDIQRYFYFFREFFNQSIGKGIVPWWNPYLFGGEPFLSNPQFVLWYPVSWIFEVAPLRFAFAWYLAFHVFWAMLGMYALSRTINYKLLTYNKKKNTRTFDIAAWVSGVVFGLSGFFMARIFAGHIDVIAGASWMPWVVWGFYSLVRTEDGIFRFHSQSFSHALASVFRILVPPKSKSQPFLSGSSRQGQVATLRNGTPPHTNLTSKFVIAVIVFAFQLLAGYQTMAMMSVIIVGVLAISVSLSQRRVKPILRALAAGVFGIGLTAFHLVPVSEFFRQSIRTYQLPYSWHSYGAIEWRSVLQLLNPFLFGNHYSYSGPPPNFGEHSMFVGIGGLLLAVIGFVYSIQALRSVFCVFSPSRNGILPWAGFSFFCVGLFGFWVSLGPNAPIDLHHILWNVSPMYQYIRIPSRHLILVVFGLSGLTGLGMSLISAVTRRWISWAVSGVVVFEMVLFGRNFIELKPVPEARHDKKLIALLKQDKEPYRVLQDYGAWLQARDALDFDSVMPYGIYSASGYDPSIVKTYYEYIARASGGSGEKAMLSFDVQVPYLTPKSAQTIDTLNIKYIIVPPDYDPFAKNPRYSFIGGDEKNTYRLYENTTVLPRFYLRDRSCGTVDVTSYAPNRITLSTESTCDTWLMSSEVWYPGWEAYVDGKITSINKSNGVFRTLFVQRGNHVVEYRYNPKIYLLGGAITLCTAVFLLIWSKRAR